MRILRAATVSAGLLVLFAGCGDGDGNGSFSPTVDNVAGTYSATTFTANTTATGTVDLLALGASVTVTLAPDGSTTGNLFVPGIVVGGADVDEDLTGTWTLSGSTVTFNQTADTFIRDLDFAATENQLTSEGVFDGATLRIVLTKTAS